MSRMSLFYNKIALYILLLAVAAGCGQLPRPVLQPTQTQLAVSSMPPTNSLVITNKACKNIKQEMGLPTLKKSHIIYVASSYLGGSTTTRLWVLSLSDGSEKPLLNDVSDLGIGFLPDGFHFLLVGSRVMVSDLDGSPLKAVDSSNYAQDFPRYSPMWNLIANDQEVNRNQSGVAGLLLYSPDQRHIAIWRRYGDNEANVDGSYPLIFRDKKTGKDIELLRTDPGEAILGNWSPNGQQFVYIWRGVAYVVNADGSGTRALTNPEEPESLERPRWSPDGKKIAIPVWNRSGGMDIMIINYLTGKINRFIVSPIMRLNSVMDQSEMVWSPNGDWFAYISQSREHFGLEILNVESGEIYCGKDDKNLGIEMIDWR